MNDNPFSRLKPASPLRNSKDITFEAAHANSDVDVDRSAMHHTLGAGPTEAAAGDHKHTGIYIPVTTVLPWVANPRPETGAWANLNVVNVYAEQTGLRVFGELTFHVIAAGTGAGACKFTLPKNCISTQSIIGCAREDAVIGHLFSVNTSGGADAVLLRYDNAGTANISGYKYQIEFNYRVAS